MAFTQVPTISPSGGKNAEEASIEALARAVREKTIASLDYRQQGILTSAIAVLRGVRTRARTMPSHAMVGNEMHSVLTELQSLPEGSVDQLAASLAAASEQWDQQLKQPVGVPPEMAPAREA